MESNFFSLAFSLLLPFPLQDVFLCQPVIYRIFLSLSLLPSSLSLFFSLPLISFVLFFVSFISFTSSYQFSLTVDRTCTPLTAMRAPLYTISCRLCALAFFAYTCHCVSSFSSLTASSVTNVSTQWQWPLPLFSSFLFFFLSFPSLLSFALPMTSLATLLLISPHFTSLSTSSPLCWPFASSSSSLSSPPISHVKSKRLSLLPRSLPFI